MSQLTLPAVDPPAGCCHFVATPIGNLGDVGLRALAILAAVDIVYAEDTRHTGRLLQRYGIRARLQAYHDHNKAQVVPRIVASLREGARVAVVSDAGTPGVSDPGFTLIRALAAAELPWTTVPGPSSILAALLLSGFATDRFLYLGYCPRKAGPRQRFLADALTEPGTVIVLESVHRVRKTVASLAEQAPRRRLAVVREITKIHEEALRGTADEVLPLLTERRLRGELVLVIEGAAAAPASATE